MANLANFELGRSSIRNPSERNDREEDGREMNEHVGVDLIELDILVASDGYTRFLYLERPHLCPSWLCNAPWNGVGLNVR